MSQPKPDPVSAGFDAKAEGADEVDPTTPMLAQEGTPEEDAGEQPEAGDVQDAAGAAAPRRELPPVQTSDVVVGDAKDVPDTVVSVASPRVEPTPKSHNLIRRVNSTVALDFGDEEGDDFWMTARAEAGEELVEEEAAAPAKAPVKKLNHRQKLTALFHSTTWMVVIIVLLLVDAAFVAAELVLEASETPECDEHGELTEPSSTVEHTEEALHYASVTILSFFVLELVLRFYASPKACAKSCEEIADAIIVIPALVLQVLFGENGGGEALGLLVLLRLWRLTRIAHGLIITVKFQATKAILKERKRTIKVQHLLDAACRKLHAHGWDIDDVVEHIVEDKLKQQAAAGGDPAPGKASHARHLTAASAVSTPTEAKGAPNMPSPVAEAKAAEPVAV